MTDETGIAPIVDPASVFTRGGSTVDAVIADIKQRAGSLVFDMRTAAGRSYCASVAYQVSRSKTLIDNAGKKIVSDWKAKSRKVDLDRKKIRDELDAIRDSVRAPLNEWEARQAREKERRVRKIDSICRLGAVTDQNGNNLSAAECSSRLDLLNDIPEPDDWFRSMLPEAAEAYRDAHARLSSALALRREEERAAADESERAAQAVRAAEEEAQAEARRKIEADKAAAVALARADEKAKAAAEAERIAQAARDAEATERAKVRRRVEEEKAAAVEKARAEEMAKAAASARHEAEELKRITARAKAVENAFEAPVVVDHSSPSLPKAKPACRAEIDREIRAAVVSALIDLHVPIGVVNGVVTAIAAGEVPYVSLTTN